ncbi:MAG: hypothetical protein FJ357_06450 [Thaumarchaeota archaeon]|nr:hypothetical protein [Nitrososphaerota archaeon]
MNELANLKFNLGKMLGKSKPKSLVFQSLLNGEDITLDVCSFEEVLPYSLLSIPVSTITPHDNVWIASSMLSRIADVTNNLVVVEDEFPIGTISTLEIIEGLQKNPTSSFFSENITKIMNPDFYIDSRTVNISAILDRMGKSKNPFSIIQNDKTSFSQFSVRQALEIGALCKTDIGASSFAQKRIPRFSRDNTISDIVEKIRKEQTEFALLEDEFTFVNYDMILEKLKELNNTQSEDLLNLSASTLKTITPMLISDKLSLAEICRIMLNVKHPCVMTQDKIITARDVLEVLCRE